MRRILCCLVLLAALGAVPLPADAQSPVTKRCVGDPPRQTEDPMSPPCVAFFDGYNGGDLSPPSVTADEFRVLVYFDSAAYNFEISPGPGTYVDLDDPPKPPCPKTWPAFNPERDRCDSLPIRIARAYALYFADRFQTYERRPHYYAYFTAAPNAASRRADAADNWQRIRPFAVLDHAVFNGYNEAYDDAMAARGVMVFGSRSPATNTSLRKNAPFQWSFWPDVEHQAALYSSYVCSTLAARPASHFGGLLPSGGPRKFGLYHTSDPGEPALRVFAELVKEQIRSCGVADAPEGTFDNSGFIIDNDDDGLDQLQAVTRFLASGVTTVLWLGGLEGRFSHWADKLKYYPEIVLAGDLQLDGNYPGRFQNQNVWRNAWAVQHQIRMDAPGDTPGFRAYRESDPRAALDEARIANELYRDHFMLFVAAQAAGPYLTAGNVDLGLHAIPAHSSTGPYVAACYFDAGDYSCVKDATEVWWDPAGLAPAGLPGCMRMVREGRRFRAGKWPGTDDVFASRGDPCNGFEGTAPINP